MTKLSSPRVLVLYIEPTSYIVDLIERIYDEWGDQIEIIFLFENKTQVWGLSRSNQWKFIPDNFFKRIVFIASLFKNNYQLVHMAGWSEPIILLFYLWAKLRRIPVVIESDSQDCEASYWKTIIKSLVYPFLFQPVSIFMPGGKRQLKYLMNYGVPLNKMYPAQMTVDVLGIVNYVKKLTNIDKINIRKNYGLTEKNIVFLFVGRLISLKGVSDLLSAFSQIKAQTIDLLFVGEGELAELIKKAGEIDSRVHYLARLSGSSLIDVYFAADVLVLPSHFEHWGLVVNEAMAVGRPVIASDAVGCIDDLIVNEESGLIFKKGNVAQLQEAMEYMIYHSEAREAMAIKTKELIAHWTLENEAENICRVWRNLGAKSDFNL